MRLHAWQMERDLRTAAVPLDRRSHGSTWFDPDAVVHGADDLMLLFWNSTVPGSGAPECPYQEMVQSMANRGYAVEDAEELLEHGKALAAAHDVPALRALSGELLRRLFDAPRDPASSYWGFSSPATWQAVREDMTNADASLAGATVPDLEERMYSAWIGQLAGGAFGTAIEGYTGSSIRAVYGNIEGYVTAPETMNDDVVYELAFLDAVERHGRGVTSTDIAREWLEHIPFGWSAEWVALQNLRAGIFPPDSGTFRNPYVDWIGCQMRGMVCGMVVPGRPLESARLAHVDGVVSHAGNGVYGGIYAAVLSSLAFVRDDVRQVLVEASSYLPRHSEYAAVVQECLQCVAASTGADDALQWAGSRFEQYNWIHAYPNITAVIVALWFGHGDMTATFKLLAHAGLDVDCNAGLAGTILGAMHGVPSPWQDPLGDRLETYIAGKESLSIRELSARTARLTHIMTEKA